MSTKPAALFILLTTATLPSPSFAGQGFSGKWVLDESAAQCPVAPSRLIQEIKDKNNQILIESAFGEPSAGIAPLVLLGIMTSSLTLSTDGQESANQVGPFAFVAKTTVGGETMITEWRAAYNGDPVQGKWVRTLSPDGKHMTLDITESSTQGQQASATLFFVRK